MVCLHLRLKPIEFRHMAECFSLLCAYTLRTHSLLDYTWIIHGLSGLYAENKREKKRKNICRT